MTRPKLLRLSKIQLLKKNIKCKEQKILNPKSKKYKNKLCYEKSVLTITATFKKKISLIHKIERLIDALI
jgi:hypothetical protein